MIPDAALGSVSGKEFWDLASVKSVSYENCYLKIFGCCCSFLLLWKYLCIWAIFIFLSYSIFSIPFIHLIFWTALFRERPMCLY